MILHSCLSNRSVIYLSLLIFLLPVSNSQLPPSIQLNSSANGTTEGAQIGLFTKFKRLDTRYPPIGLGGQRVYQLQIPPELSSTNVAISTCQETNFDTYIAILNENPQLQRNTTLLSESGNDIDCKNGRDKAFLSTKLAPGQYFLLITGNAKEEGNFTVSVTGASATQPPLPWGLDRIDQRRLPLDQKFDVKPTGAAVWVYLIDSGVRTTHQEFEGRAESGYDFVNNKEAVSPDCTGHGTHVAGIIAGKTYGVSKQARIVSVRAFDCNNTARVSAIVDALGWALIDARFKERTNAVIAMMFSTKAIQSSILQAAVLGLQRSGFPVIVPAGNNGQDACDFYPGSLETFITVGSTGPGDARSVFSNSGNCTKLYAPGESIVSSWHNSDTSWRVMGGTAQAAAHVTGVVSNLMNLNPRLKANVVKNIIQSVSTLDVVGNVDSGESTRLAFVRSVPEFTGNDPPPKKEVFLFIILRLHLSSCAELAEHVGSIKQVFADELDIRTSRVDTNCKSQISNASSRLVEIRFQVAERTAVADFTLLERLLILGKGGLEFKLGHSFEVVEEPWAVDSNLVIFWGAPTFSEAESDSLSSGAIAGIVVGVFFLISIVTMISWIAYRRYAKLDVIESMEGSGDFEKGPVHFKDFENSGGESAMMRSFRNVMKSIGRKKSGTVRQSMPDASERGINRMGSFIGGPTGDIGKDMVRVDSFGGEAFAGMASLLRNSRGDLNNSSPESNQRDTNSSFRGANNLVLKPSSIVKEDAEKICFDDGKSEDFDESLRMRSLGGEAFAMIGLDSRSDSRQSSNAESSRRGPTTSTAICESYEPEALAESDSDPDSGFFSP